MNGIIHYTVIHIINIQKERLFSFIHTTKIKVHELPLSLSYLGSTSSILHYTTVVQYD